MDAALELGFPCGGWCPAGRLAEDGKIPKRYPVVELANGGYAERTAKNVADSDGTLIIAHGPLIGGTHETVKWCIEMQKRHLVIDCASASIEEAIERATKFVRALSSTSVRPPSNVAPNPSDALRSALNIAGPRASQWPQAHDVTHEIVSGVLRQLSGHNRPREYSA